MEAKDGQAEQKKSTDAEQTDAKTPTETPAVEAPAVEPPAVETAAVEPLAVETAAVETPAAEPPAVETAAVEIAAVETPAAAADSIEIGADLSSVVLDAYQAVVDGKETNVFARPFGTSFPEGKSAGEEDKAWNHFCFFLKPEATAAAVKTDLVLRAVLEKLAGAGVQVGGVRVCGGKFLEANEVMSQHYGVISAISKQGAEAISEDAKAKLAEMNEEGLVVLGAHQFLETEEGKAYTPVQLRDANTDIGCTRLAGGTYALKLEAGGKTQIVLNAFHPFQLVPFHEGSIVVFEGRTQGSWAALRGEICGATNPATAVEGSIRNMILQRKDEFNLEVVDTSNNGVHCSAGPLEGMVELRRFFKQEGEADIPLDQTLFGALWGAGGNDMAALETMSASTALFDDTEEKNAGEAVDILTTKVP